MQALRRLCVEEVSAAEKHFERLGLEAFPAEYLTALEEGGKAAVTACEGAVLGLVLNDRLSTAEKRHKLEVALTTHVKTYSDRFQCNIAKAMQPVLREHALSLTLKV